MGLKQLPPGDLTLLFFKYRPNEALAIVGLVVYALFVLYFTFRIYRSKSARFLYILPFTAAMEVAGYVLRLLCHNYTDLGRFLGSTLCLLLAPNVLALVNYKVVGEMIRLSQVEAPKKYFFLRPGFVTWFFFTSDIISFLLQSAGGGMQATIEYRSTAIAITLFGLSMQLFFLACFVVITINVGRSNKYYTEPRLVEASSSPNPKKKLIICMLLVVTFIYIRSIYRIAEYATGYGGPIAVLEWAFYVFDTLAIAICFVVYIFLFPGDYLPKHNSSYYQHKDLEHATKQSSSETTFVEKQKTGIFSK